MTDEPERPSLNKPLHGEPRPLMRALLIVIGILAIVALAMIVIGWLRYNT